MISEAKYRWRVNKLVRWTDRVSCATDLGAFAPVYDGPREIFPPQS